MSEIIERIKKYIEENPVHSSEMTTKEILALVDSFSAIEAVLWAFTYGWAKGYRAAKAEVRR